MQTIGETIKQLHTSLCDYIEATYHISDPSLIAQRRKLMEEPQVISQVPYLESTPRYKSDRKFADIGGLPSAALTIFKKLSSPEGALEAILYDPPYKHQSEAIQNSLVEGKNLVIMTGTGSGKTESFLLPIIGKLAREAEANPKAFAEQFAVRALILYPMNALVNDQLGRLRSLFGDPRVVKQFKSWAGRPPRFARYTSRTPYAGVRTTKADQRKLRPFEDFYVEIERQAREPASKEQAQAVQLLADLKSRGKWPAKSDLVAWYGKKASPWQDRKTGEFLRAVTLPDDVELLTRHEVQDSPPDLLVTNYSMLEYMLMRPVERTIFDQTRDWLIANPNEKFLIVLDEAHLYRGAAGAEVGLLLRRLRDRLGIPRERFQVICATASFSDPDYAPDFGAQLSGVHQDTFVPIVGDYAFWTIAAPGSRRDAEVLASIDLDAFHASEEEDERLKLVKPLLDYRSVKDRKALEQSLFAALRDFAPLGLLVNGTMKRARRIEDLGEELFPDAGDIANRAASVLMALGSMARKDSRTPGLLPCRIHNFFRGLPGLWVCMDPACTEVAPDHRNNISGKMFGQPQQRCECGARVLEFYTCRHCGTAYARAYTDDVDNPSALWSEPGRRLRMEGGSTEPLLPIDLLLEAPTPDGGAEIADYDLETGRINPDIPGP
ncbi:MAG: DEAD/DEAH box helicase, partial [Rhodospirillaceae bacterium]|nr:DEAD/DEAH box helicase [Rhodospirillaceae bacterium]